MKIEIDSKMLKADFAGMVSGLVITGEYKFKGKKHKLRSEIGKACGRKIALSLYGYLKAWEVKS